MTRVYKPNWSWLLMAAMTLLLSCSDDDHLSADDIEPEPTEEELAELAAADRLEAANYVIRAFAGLDALPDNWETSTFEPQEGVVVDEAKPTVRSVIVENQEEADQYFVNITPDEAREATGSGYRYSVEGIGSISYQRVNSSTCFATIDVALRQMPKLTQIRLVPESEVPTNAKFDGKPYYGIGSSVKDKDSGRYYICIRPSGGPNRKEYAYFVTFDVKAIDTSKKTVDLYTIDNNGKKTKTKADTSGEWVYGKNLVEKRFALLAANFFARLNEIAHAADPYWSGAAQELLDFYRDVPGLDFTGKEHTEYIVPYASYKSSTAGSQRQAKYEQPCLRWSMMYQLGFDGMGARRAACYVNLRPDAKSHNISLTDDYDPSYYYNWSKALDPEDIIRWDGKKVGYDTPFNLKEYGLKQDQSRTFYSDMHHWGLGGVEIKVLLMAQKKITDKGQAYKNFDETSPGTVVLDALQQIVGSRTFYQRIYEGVQYYEITDGKKTSYASDEPKELEESPDI